jgi:hypothetical protein
MQLNRTLDPYLTFLPTTIFTVVGPNEALVICCKLVGCYCSSTSSLRDNAGGPQGPPWHWPLKRWIGIDWMGQSNPSALRLHLALVDHGSTPDRSWVDQGTSVVRLGSTSPLAAMVSPTRPRRVPGVVLRATSCADHGSTSGLHVIHDYCSICTVRLVDHLAIISFCRQHFAFERTPGLRSCKIRRAFLDVSCGVSGLTSQFSVKVLGPGLPSGQVARTRGSWPQPTREVGPHDGLGPALAKGQGCHPGPSCLALGQPSCASQLAVKARGLAEPPRKFFVFPNQMINHRSLR